VTLSERLRRGAKLGSPFRKGWRGRRKGEDNEFQRKRLTGREGGSEERKYVRSEGSL